MADRKTDMERGSDPGISRGADSLLRASLDHIRHGVLIYDRDLVIVAINNRTRDILRLPDALLKVGDPFEKYVRIISKRGGYGDSSSVEDRVMARMTYAKTFAPYRVEQTTIHGDNVEVFGQPVEEVGYVTTYTDITSRVQAEHSVRRNEQRVLDFAEASSDWFWETDSTHCYS
jgi:PAS domain-containing protein